MLVPDLAAVIWLWPFTVQDHIYGRSNFGHRFCLLALLTKFMVKIWVAINMVLNCKWPKPDYSSKVRHQHIKILAHLHKKLAQHGSAEWPVFVIAARRGNSATDDTYGHVGTRKYENQKYMMKDCWVLSFPILNFTKNDSKIHRFCTFWTRRFEN